MLIRTVLHTTEVSKMSFFSSRDTNITPGINLVTGIVCCINLFIGVADHVRLEQLNALKPPTLVERADGSSFAVDSIDHNDRSTKAIRNFVANKMVSFFAFSNILPPRSLSELRNPVADPGIKIESNKYVTTPAAEAALAIKDDKFRTSFLKFLAELTPQDNFRSDTKSSQKQTSTLDFIFISSPRPLAGKPGIWETDVIANRSIYRNQVRVGDLRAINKTIVTEARDIFPPPNWASEQQKISYREQIPGLTITEIRDYQLGSPQQYNNAASP